MPQALQDVLESDMVLNYEQRFQLLARYGLQAPVFLLGTCSTFSDVGHALT